MNEVRSGLTLDRPTTYTIRVPGELNERWNEWNGYMSIEVDCESDGRPITILTGTVDQATLHGLLRQLYALGLPLISVNSQPTALVNER